ncbi:ParB/RepB/Spo0J family partition protein [Hamadaea sp. NPDC051192]|uniref:ParB/RepB/Spo0J family partition protein n=1 Tax=Hamadaea sp. NPDC051192 TaxID=3154940 RepID=UPI003439D4F9
MTTTKTPARKRGGRKTTPAPVTVSPQPRAELRYVDPARLIIGTNVRTAVDLSPEFLASIAEYGVQEPITVRETEPDTFEVIKGQRRALAAVKVGRPEVPILVRAAPDDAQRVAAQLTENILRDAMTASDTAAALDQLVLFGMTAGDIARTGLATEAEVNAATRLTKSRKAQAVADAHPLTLEQSAGLIEFEDDPDAVETLISAAYSGQFEHEAQRLRDARDRAAYRQSLIDQLTEAGIRVIDEPRSWIKNNTGKVENLYDRDGNKVDPQAHTTCAGHSAYIANTYGRDEPPYVIGYACRDLSAYRHYDAQRPTKLRSADMTTEEKAAAKADRKDVLDSNRAWDSAEKVRRAWLAKFFQTKTAPKGAAKFIAESLARADHELSQALSGNNEMALNLLGIKTTSRIAGCQALAAQMARASEGRAQLLTLALILSAYEARTTKQAYRHHHTATSRYLLFLQSLGYALSDVEKRATITAAPAADPGEPAKPEPAEADDDRDTDTAQAPPAEPAPVTNDPGERSQDHDGEDDGDRLEQMYAAEIEAAADPEDLYAEELTE